MKRIFAFILFLMLSNFGYAQSIVADEGLEKLGGGYNTAIRVYLPYVTLDMLQDAWVDFLKDNNAKVKKSKEEIDAKNLVISGLGGDTISVFSTIVQVDSGYQLAAVFMRDNVSISTKNHPKEASWIVKFFKEWGTKLSNQALESRIQDQEKVIKEKNKDKRSLENNNDYLLQSNANMKKQIGDNEKRIDENKLKITNTISEIDSVSLLIQQIKIQQQNLK